MMWQYKLHQQRIIRQTSVRDIHVDGLDEMLCDDRSHLRAKSRIQAPRPRPKGYWSPYSPY